MGNFEVWYEQLIHVRVVKAEEMRRRRQDEEGNRLNHSVRTTFAFIFSHGKRICSNL